LLLLAVAVVVLSWWIGGRLANIVRVPKALAPNLFVSDLVRLSMRLLLTLIGIVLAAEMLGATALLVSVLGGLGVVGLAVGFAIRDTVENFVASVLLSIRQPFGANELVQIDGQEGRIVRLTSRATIMLDLDGNHVRIPNGTVYKSTILNFTRNPMRRFSFDVGVDTDIDPNFAQQLAEAALAEVPGVLVDPKSNCVVQELGDSNVVLRAYAWIDQAESDFTRTRSAGMVAVKRAFEKADVTMPEPIYRLRVENVDLDNAGAASKAGSIDQTPLPLEETQADTAIEEQVEQHRNGDDLLSSAAPRE
jgi:small-conductance mechanosensitive channel